MESIEELFESLMRGSETGIVTKTDETVYEFSEKEIREIIGRIRRHESVTLTPNPRR